MFKKITVESTHMCFLDVNSWCQTFVIVIDIRATLTHKLNSTNGNCYNKNPIADANKTHCINH